MKQLYQKHSIDISEKQIKQFNTYYELLIDWNQKINLTTITDYEDVVKKHFLDSCLLLKVFQKEDFFQKKIIDVGTGAGFPGVPLAILLSDVSFTLVDSLNKRIDFLKVLCNTLQLDNVELYHGRAEELGRDVKFREQFDFCVSRAVAGLPILLEYCSPFIRKEGSLLLYKSKKTSDEIVEAENAHRELRCQLRETFELAKEPDFERYLLNIEKVDHTPDKYPRRAGQPKKKPL